jgi:hypothetical protein
LRVVFGSRRRPAHEGHRLSIRCSEQVVYFYKGVAWWVDEVALQPSSPSRWTRRPKGRRHSGAPKA